MLYEWKLVLMFLCLVIGFFVGRFYQREEDDFKQKCNMYGSYTKMCKK